MKKEHFEILLEEMNSKFQIVLEAHDALRKEIQQSRDESNAKHDHTAFMIETLNRKIDAVAADVSAHRADTEAHHGIYVVKEP